MFPNCRSNFSPDLKRRSGTNAKLYCTVEFGTFPFGDVTHPEADRSRAVGWFLLPFLGGSFPPKTQEIPWKAGNPEFVPFFPHENPGFEIESGHQPGGAGVALRQREAAFAV